MNTMLKTLALSSLLATLGACEGAGSLPANMGNDTVDAGTTVGGVNAREVFTQDVQGLLDAKCASCHVEGNDPLNALKFMGGAGSDYDLVVTYDSVHGGFNAGAASLLRKGAHSGSGWWTPEEEATISGWITAESDARELGGDQPPLIGTPKTSREALMQWSGCMNITDWQETNMGDWADKQAEGTQCSSCHGDGLARFNTNADDTDMFLMNQYEAFIIGFVTVKLDPVTAAPQVIPAYEKLEAMGNGSTLHPTYNYSPDNRNMQDLQNFYEKTKARVEAGNCAPAAFPQL